MTDPMELLGLHPDIPLTALRLRMQSSLHLLPSTTGLFRKISGLSLAAEEEEEEDEKNSHPSFLSVSRSRRSSDRSCDQLLR